jgi:hypothetical protein
MVSLFLKTSTILCSKNSLFLLSKTQVLGRKKGIVKKENSGYTGSRWTKLTLWSSQNEKSI